MFTLSWLKLTLNRVIAVLNSTEFKAKDNIESKYPDRALFDAAAETGSTQIPNTDNYMAPMRGSLRGTHGPSRHKVEQGGRMIELSSQKQSELACLYHALIFQGKIAKAEEALLPMQRFLLEGPSEQYALYVRADNGKISTDRSCKCWRMLENDLQIFEDEGAKGDERLDNRQCLK